MDVRSNPGSHIHGREYLCIEQFGCTQHSNEEVGSCNLTGFPVEDLHCWTYPVYIGLFTGLVDLMHRKIALPPPFQVIIAELAVTQTVRILLQVFLPEQLQGDPLSLKLRMDEIHVRQRTFRPVIFIRIKLVFKHFFRHLVNHWPVKSKIGSFCAFNDGAYCRW